MICLVTTVVRRSNRSTAPDTNRKKLYFLLSDSATFSEDDDTFRTFFINRWESLDDLRKKVERLFDATIAWLVGEVFTQDTRKGKTEAEIQQDEFEKQFARELNDAIALESAM